VTTALPTASDSTVVMPPLKWMVSRSTVEAARAARTVTLMSEIEAGELGVEIQDRRRYVRLDEAKNNMSPPATVATWLERDSVFLQNGTGLNVMGDSVGVFGRWTPPDAFDGLGNEVIRAILYAIEEGFDAERRYIAGKNSPRWVGHVIRKTGDKFEGQAKQIVNRWLETGLLEKRSHANAKTRKRDDNAIFVNWSLRSRL
jgi:hypothetical protein